MFTPAEQAKLKAAQLQAFAQLSIPATWTQTKAPKATKAISVGFKTAGFKDEIIVNSYGVGAKIITMKQSYVPGMAKFDRITVGTERYTADAVHPVHLGSEVLFWKIIVKGR